MENNLIFYSKRYKGIPYIKKLIEYQNDGEKGHILFDGAYYVISTIDISDKNKSCDENLILIYKEIYIYIIQVYNVEIIEDTSIVSEEEDSEGNSILVYFFPTNIQKLYFNILHTLDIDFLNTEEFKKYKCKQWNEYF